MIFRNTMRLLLSNFSNVWKALLYYIICILFTVVVCWGVSMPIIEKLDDANIFKHLFEVINGVVYNKTGGEVAMTLNQVLDTAWGIIISSIEFRFNYIFLIVWIVFVFPFTLDLAQLALGEVLYAFMTSQVKYGFTGRFIKNIGKSCSYSFFRYLVQFVFNAIIVALFVGIIKLATLGVVYILLDIVLFALTLCFISFKHTLFSCWMPSIAVLNCNTFKALKNNFRIVFKKFFNIFSNCLTLVLTAFVLNFIFYVFTFSVSMVVTFPLTAFVFVIFQMVTYFSNQGMRFYVYPDMFISPKKFEEQDKIKKLKYLI